MIYGLLVFIIILLIVMHAFKMRKMETKFGEILFDKIVDHSSYKWKQIDEELNNCIDRIRIYESSLSNKCTRYENNINDHYTICIKDMDRIVVSTKDYIGERIEVETSHVLAVCKDATLDYMNEIPENKEFIQKVVKSINTYQVNKGV